MYVRCNPAFQYYNPPANLEFMYIFQNKSLYSYQVYKNAIQVFSLTDFSCVRTCKLHGRLLVQVFSSCPWLEAYTTPPLIGKYSAAQCSLFRQACRSARLETFGYQSSSPWPPQQQRLLLRFRHHSRSHHHNLPASSLTPTYLPTFLLHRRATNLPFAPMAALPRNSESHQPMRAL